MDFLLIAFLTALNGLFAMSEMAVSTSRKARLTAMAEAGDRGARVALELQDHPTRFLSTVQVGITSIGMLNGIIGEAAFSADVSQWFAGVGLSDTMASISATALVVTLITFVTIVFGELVPKRIGQMFPEPVARWIAPPMNGLARIAGPFVRLLSVTTQAALRLVGLDRHRGPGMTEEEIAASLAEGVDAGVIEAHERQMVHNVFHLDDRPLTSMMTPREDMVFFRAERSVRECVLHAQCLPDGTRHGNAGHSWYPVCKDDLDEVVGVVSMARLTRELVEDSRGDRAVSDLMEPAHFAPESLSGLELLEQFRLKSARMVLVVDEYGVVQGLLTPKDMLEAITGELKPASQAQQWATPMPDGAWELDGMMPIAEFKARLNVRELPDEDKDRYNTVAGLLMNITGDLSGVGSHAHVGEWRLEVLDVQGRRIDRIRATRLAPAREPGQ